MDYEPNPRGSRLARQKIFCSLLTNTKNTNAKIDPEQMFLFSGTSEIYAHLLRLTCNQGESVLIPTPSYPLFEELCRYCDVRPISYHLHYDNAWHIDLQSVEQGLRLGARAIILIHPGNPTGAYVRKSEQIALNELSNRFGVPLIVDEVFYDYPLDEQTDSACSFITNTNRLTFVLNGLSKRTGLPQLKLAWLIVCGSDRDLIEKSIYRLDMLADIFLSVGTPIQSALPRLCPEVFSERHALICGRVQSNHEYLMKQFASGNYPVSYLKNHGGWSAILRLPQIQTCEEWAIELAQKQRTLVQPGYFYDIHEPSRVVISLLTEPTVLQKGIDCITSCIL